MKEVYVVNCCRTAIGSFGGSLKDTPAAEMGDQVDAATAECIVAKNRHGETGTVKLMWDGQFTRFSNAEMRDEG